MKLLSSQTLRIVLLEAVCVARLIDIIFETPFSPWSEYAAKRYRRGMVRLNWHQLVVSLFIRIGCIIFFIPSGVLSINTSLLVMRTRVMRTRL